MLRTEWGRAVRRWRTYALAAVLASVPLLYVVALYFNPPGGGGDGGPPFLAQTVTNGLFAPIVSLFVMQPFLLPLTAGLLSGDSIAGESSAGTLRYLLVRPVGRTRLVLWKYASVVTLLGAAVGWVIVVGLVAGWMAFDIGPLATLSGDTLSIAGGAWRVLLVGGYVLAGVAGLAAVGVFVSTLTESGPGATVATVAVAIVSQILGALSQVEFLHPYLLTQPWGAVPELLRSPIAFDPILDGLVVYAAYVAVFVGLAVLVLRRRDVAT